MNDKKTNPRVNLILIMLVTALFSFLCLFLVEGKSDLLFLGAANVIALIVTSLLTQGDTDKEVPMSTHLAIMGLRRSIQTECAPPANPFRINLLFGFALLCALALFVLWRTAIQPEIVLPAVFTLAVVMGKKLSDPGANDKVVPEEVTLAEIDALAAEWEETPASGTS